MRKFQSLYYFWLFVPDLLMPNRGLPTMVMVLTPTHYFTTNFPIRTLSGLVKIFTLPVLQCIVCPA